MDNFDSNEEIIPVSETDNNPEPPEELNNQIKENTDSPQLEGEPIAETVTEAETNETTSVWEAYMETVTDSEESKDSSPSAESEDNSEPDEEPTDEELTDEELNADSDDTENDKVITYDEQLIKSTKRFITGKISRFMALDKRKQKKYLITFAIVVILLTLILTDIIPILPNSYHRSYVGNRYTLGETQSSDTAKYGKNVLYASNGTLICFGPDMSVKNKIDTFAGHPIIRTADTGAVVYSKNGDKAIVMTDYDKYFAVNSNEAIISASVNKKGDYILVTVEAGYKACLSAYNSKQSPLYKWHTGSHITDTAISPAGTEFVASVIEKTETEVHSKLVFLSVASQEPVKEVAIEGCVVTGLHFVDSSTVVAFGDSFTKAFSPNGAEKWSVDYNGKFLKTYDVSKDGQIAFLFNSFNSDLSDSLVELYNHRGRKIGHCESKDNVRSISVNNGHCLLMLDKETIIADSDGDIKKRKKHNSDYSRVVLFDNYHFAFGINDNVAEIISVRHR